MVRVVRLERTVSWSQTRRDTNFAIPGYSIFVMIPRRAEKIKFFLSVVIHVVKATFMPFSAIGENPANAGVTRLCGVSPCPVPDTATALPKQAHYAWIFSMVRQSRKMRKLNSELCSHRLSAPRSQIKAAPSITAHWSIRSGTLLDQSTS